MSKEVGTFFIIIGLLGMIIFFASTQADETLCNVGLLSLASILLGIYIRSRKPKIPPTKS